MSQTSFVEPLKHKRRKTTAPAKIAETIGRLADFYAVNKPGLKSISISADDAYSLRKYWATKNDKTNGERECRSVGFHISDDGAISWRGFDLIPVDG